MCKCNPMSTKLILFETLKVVFTPLTCVLAEKKKYMYVTFSSLQYITASSKSATHTSLTFLVRYYGTDARSTASHYVIIELLRKKI